MVKIPAIDMTATGNNIYVLRKKAGLSVKDLQDIFGFAHPQAIYKSTPAGITIKETSFVYQGKRRFFLLFRAKYGQNRINASETGFEMAIAAVPEPVFSFRH